jgi:hypothetical protein
LKDLFSGSNGLGGAAKKYKSVVRVLEDRARLIVDDGVANISDSRMKLQKPTENISNNYEEIRGKGITLSEAALTVDPFPRITVEEHSCLASLKDVHYPSVPFLGEASVTHDNVQAFPINTIECFMEIKFQNDGWASSSVTTAEEISSINKIISNAPSLYKTGLISADEVRNEMLQALHQDSGDGLNNCILESNGSELLGAFGTFFLRKQD